MHRAVTRALLEHPSGHSREKDEGVARFPLRYNTAINFDRGRPSNSIKCRKVELRGDRARSLGNYSRARYARAAFARARNTRNEILDEIPFPRRMPDGTAAEITDIINWYAGTQLDDIIDNGRMALGNVQSPSIGRVLIGRP